LVILSFVKQLITKNILFVISNLNRMKRCLNLFKKNLLLGIILLFPAFCFSQNLVADSVIIQFGKPEPVEKLSFNISDAKDFRKVFPEFISVFERKKLFFFPVDQIVKTSKPLAEHFKQKFHSDSLGVSTYVTNIHNFTIKNSSSFGKRNLGLYATIELSEILGERDTSLVGTFYYERSFLQKKKQDITDGYEQLIEKWCQQYVADILLVEENIDQKVPDLLYYFRRGDKAVKKNFYTSVDLFAGLNFYGVDGELWFSEPEGNLIFNRNSATIRYVNHPSFQSIAIGSNLRHWNYRVNDSWLFTNKMAMLVGVNNWKDMDTAKHKFEEILFFNCSMTQRLNFNRLDKSGFVFGIGIMEDLHYIIYHRIGFDVGASVSFAYKF